MDLASFFTLAAEQYGLVAVYALIISWAGLQAHSTRHLLMMLSIMAGVFVVMFKAFDLKRDIDVFGLADRLGLQPDFANAVAALLLTYVLGFAVYGAKRLAHRPRADA